MLRVVRLQPAVERVVEKEIHQQRTEHTALRQACGPRLHSSVPILKRYREPPLDVEQDPGTGRMLP
jgi:hypothetical protein